MKCQNHKSQVSVAVLRRTVQNQRLEKVPAKNQARRLQGKATVPIICNQHWGESTRLPFFWATTSRKRIKSKKMGYLCLHQPQSRVRQVQKGKCLVAQGRPSAEAARKVAEIMRRCKMKISLPQKPSLLFLELSLAYLFVRDGHKLWQPKGNYHWEWKVSGGHTHNHSTCLHWVPLSSWRLLRPFRVLATEVAAESQRSSGVDSTISKETCTSHVLQNVKGESLFQTRRKCFASWRNKKENCRKELIASLWDNHGQILFKCPFDGDQRTASCFKRKLLRLKSMYIYKFSCAWFVQGISSLLRLTEVLFWKVHQVRAQYFFVTHFWNKKTVLYRNPLSTSGKDLTTKACPLFYRLG